MKFNDWIWTIVCAIMFTIGIFLGIGGKYYNMQNDIIKAYNKNDVTQNGIFYFCDRNLISEKKCVVLLKDMVKK